MNNFYKIKTQPARDRVWVYRITKWIKKLVYKTRDKFILFFHSICNKSCIAKIINRQ